MALGLALALIPKTVQAAEILNFLFLLPKENNTLPEYSERIAHISKNSNS